MPPLESWFSFTMFLSVAFPAAVLYLGYRLVRAFELRGASRSALAAVEERILRLEESMLAISSDLERVAEGQEFTTRLLAERQPREGTRPAP